MWLHNKTPPRTLSPKTTVFHISEALTHNPGGQSVYTLLFTFEYNEAPDESIPITSDVGTLVRSFHLLHTMSNTSPTTAGSHQSGSTAIGPVHPDKIPLGAHIESIGALFGIHPKDVAVAVASVLGGIAGPYAGFVTPADHRIRTGINVIRVGTSHRSAALEDMLLHPVRTRNRFLRGHAQGLSRTLVDQWVFGEHGSRLKDRNASNTLPWMRERDHVLAAQQYSQIRSSPLNPVHFDERELQSPCFYAGRDEGPARMCAGTEHLPSVLFERLELCNLKSALQESLHREAVLFLPAGGMFGRSAMGTAKDEALAADLAAYMMGRDVVFAPVHRDQGHGTFEHARVHFWAATSTDRIGTVLNNSSSHWNEVLRSCLLWNPSLCTTAGQAPSGRDESLRAFGRIVQRVLETRCMGRNNHQLRRSLPKDSAERYPMWRGRFDQHLVQTPESCREYIEQFHDLPERLLWMFLLFEQDEQQQGPGGAEWSPMAAAFRTAQYAVDKHVEMLQKAQAAVAEAEASRSLKTVSGILKRKGPCTLRALQRSTNNLPVTKLHPGLELLKQQGRVGVDDQHRYYLTTKEN